MGNQGCGRPARAGFTLHEVAVAAALFLIALGVFFAVAGVSRQSWETGSAEMQLRQEARRALSRIVRELRQADIGTVTVPATGQPATDIWFRIPEDQDADGEWIEGGVVEWSENHYFGMNRDGSGELLYRKGVGGAEVSVVTGDVTGLTFTRTAATPSIVDITLSLSKATPSGRVVTKSFSDRAKIRN